MSKLDDQDNYQIRQIARMMEHEGWQCLMMAWAQVRELKIISRMKQAKTELPWRYHQGRLDGFDEAIQVAMDLTGKLDRTEDQGDINKEVEELIGGRQ